MMKESSTDNTTNLAFVQLAFICLSVFIFLLSLVIKLGRKMYSKYNIIHTKQMEQQDHQIVSHSTVNVITHTSLEPQLSAPLLIKDTLNGDYNIIQAKLLQLHTKTLRNIYQVYSLHRKFIIIIILWLAR